MRAPVLIAAVLGLAVAAIDFAMRRDGAPELAVRDRPPTLVAGILGSGRDLVQTVPVAGDALTRVEFAVRSNAAPGTALGRLTVDGLRGGPVSARGELVDGPFPGARHVRFEFEDVARGDGGLLRLTLSAVDGDPELVPHLRARGVIDERDDAGRVPFGAGEHWRVLRSDLDRLSGIVLPVAAAAPGAGPVTLELHALPAQPLGRPWTPQPALGVLDGHGLDRTAPPVASVSVELPPVVAGHVPLRFEPIPDSGYRLFALRLVLPAGVRVVGGDRGFGCVGVHGAPSSQPSWSLALGGVELPAADAHVWVWTD